MSCRCGEKKQYEADAPIEGGGEQGEPRKHGTIPNPGLPQSGCWDVICVSGYCFWVDLCTGEVWPIF